MSFIPNADFALRIAQGLVTNHSLVHKFGSNTAVGTTEEDIWTPGGLITFPQAAETIRIRAGGNAADTAAGAGAQSILVTGLDDTFSPVSETIVTNGASASAATTALFCRINTVKVINVGTYGVANTGNILIENSSTNTLMAQIDALRGRTQQSQYTVPAGFTGYLQNVEIDADAVQVANVFAWERQNADDVTTPFSAKRIVRSFYGVTAQVRVEEKSTIELPAKTDIWFSGASAASTAAIGVNYDIVLIAD